MVSRPTSITVIGWYLIGFSLLGAFGYASAVFRPTPRTQGRPGGQRSLGVNDAVADLVFTGGRSLYEGTLDLRKALRLARDETI